MTTALRTALEAARDQFAFYAREHRAKCEPGKPPLTQAQRDATLEKALTNERFVVNIQQVLDAEPLNVLALEKVQDYRFGSLMKGEHYAFARGLTISPTHLPAALDAMKNDGFELVAIFGEPVSDKMGFIFRMVGPNRRVNELLAANTDLVLKNRELKDAMREFCQRVDAGEVRSTRTYAKFKALLCE